MKIFFGNQNRVAQQVEKPKTPFIGNQSVTQPKKRNLGRVMAFGLMATSLAGCGNGCSSNVEPTAHKLEIKSKWTDVELNIKLQPYLMEGTKLDTKSAKDLIYNEFDGSEDEVALINVASSRTGKYELMSDKAYEGKQEVHLENDKGKVVDSEYEKVIAFIEALKKSGLTDAKDNAEILHNTLDGIMKKQGGGY